MEGNTQNRKYLAPDETAMFCDQVSLILKSGIPLYDGIEALCDNYKDTRYGEKFKQLDEVVKKTGSLYEAVKAVGIFPPYMVSTINIGERSGTLDSVTESLSLYYIRESQIRNSVKHAVTYPLVLITMMALVIVVLVVKVFPIFTQVFRNLGAEMSQSSMAVMNFGLVTGQVVLGLVAFIIVAAAVVFLLTKTSKREAVMRFLAKLFPPVGEIRKKTAAGRFSSVMAMMLSSGFPLEEALKLVPDVLDDKEAEKKIEVCTKAMSDGESFPAAVEKSGIYEKLHTRMIRVGFMAGQMDSVMNKLANIYEDEIDDSIRRMVSLIEPTLVAVLSIIIGAVLLAVMLPLASLMSAL